jgi:CrcB protein
MAVIALGGCLGALARYEVGLSWPTSARHFPWSTFVVNTSGALFLGVVLTLMLERPARTRLLRPFLCVGFTGAWTTMSTFALETDLLVKDGRAPTALVYVVATVVVGILSAWCGIMLGRRLHARETPWRSR